MDDWFRTVPPVDRRRHPRYEILAQVTLRHGSLTHVMDVRNISVSGLFLAAGSLERVERFERGHRVEMDLFATRELDNIRVAGVVARVVDQGEPGALGIGVEFVDVDDAAHEALVRLVGMAAARSINPPPLPGPPPLREPPPEES